MKVRYPFLMLLLGMFLVSSGNAASGKIRTIHELPEYSASILVAYTGTISVPYFQTTSTSGSLDLFVTESTPVENLSTLSEGKRFQKPVSSTYIGTYTGVVPYSLILLPGNHSLFLLSGSLGQTFVFDGKRASWFDEVSSMNPSESGDVTFFVRQGDIRTVYRNTTPYLTLPTIHIDTSRWDKLFLYAYFDSLNRLNTDMSVWSSTGIILQQSYRDTKKIGDEQYQVVSNINERKNGTILLYTGRRADGNWDAVLQRTGKPKLIIGTYNDVPSFQFPSHDDFSRKQSDTRFAVYGLKESGIYEVSQYEWGKIIHIDEFTAYPSVNYGDTDSLVFGPVKDGQYRLWVNGKKVPRKFDYIYGNASIENGIPILQYTLNGKQYASVGDTIYGPYDDIMNFYYNSEDNWTFLQALDQKKGWILYTFWKWYGPYDEMSGVNTEQYYPRFGASIFQPSIASWQVFVRKNNRSYSLMNGKLTPLP